MIFSGSSKGTHTAHNDFFKLTYFQFTSLVACCLCFRLFNHHISMCLCIFVAVANLSQKLIIKIGYSGPLCRLSVPVRQHFQMASSLNSQDRFKTKFKYSLYRIGERKFIRDVLVI